MALLRAGMAEIVVGKRGDVLQALGLGSCIGLLAYDKNTGIGGLAHIMLPAATASRDHKVIVGKYADTGVPELFRLLAEKGLVRSRLVIKMAGGAEMFTFSGSDAPKLAVGARNTTAVLEELAKLGLKPSAQDTGGNCGRTLECNLETFLCTIKSIGKDLVEL